MFLVAALLLKFIIELQFPRSVSIPMFYTFCSTRKPPFCLSLHFLNFSRNWAWDFLKFFLTFSEMIYTFVIDFVYLNLNSIFKIFNAITTKYWFLANRNTKFGIEPHDFLKILTIWASFSYKLSIKDACLSKVSSLFSYSSKSVLNFRISSTMLLSDFYSDQ